MIGLLEQVHAAGQDAHLEDFRRMMEPGNAEIVNDIFRWEIPDDRYNPEARFDQNKFRETFDQAMRQLSEKYRPIIIHRIEGLSCLEISSVLGLSLGTVKSRLHRAKKRLKELLGPYWCGVEGSPSVMKVRENKRLGDAHRKKQRLKIS